MTTAASRDDAASPGSPPPECRAAHSPDFHCVDWNGQLFEFTANQAACVAVLWRAWENKTPVLGGQTILELADIPSRRLDLVFRDHPAWGTMIVAGRRRGNYRLAGATRAIDDALAESPLRDIINSNT